MDSHGVGGGNIAEKQTECSYICEAHIMLGRSSGILPQKYLEVPGSYLAAETRTQHINLCVSLSNKSDTAVLSKCYKCCTCQYSSGYKSNT